MARSVRGARWCIGIGRRGAVVGPTHNYLVGTARFDPAREIDRDREKIQSGTDGVEPGDSPG